MKKSSHLKIEDRHILRRVEDDVTQDKADSMDYRQHRKDGAELLRALELPQKGPTDKRTFRCQLPLTKIARDAMRSRIMLLLEKKRIFKPTEANDVGKVNKNQDLYEWIRGTLMKDYFDTLDRGVLTVMDEGTVFSRTTWRRDFEKQSEVREYPIPAPELNMMGQQLQQGEKPVDEETIIKDFFPESEYEITERKDISEDAYRIKFLQKISHNPEEEIWVEDSADIDLWLNEHAGQIVSKCVKKRIVYEGPEDEILDYDALYHPADAKNLQRCDHVTIKFKVPFSELLTKRDQGFYEFDDEIANEIKKSSNDVSPVDPDSLEMDEKSIEGTSQAVQPDAINFSDPEYPGMIEGYESYYLWDVDGDGYQDQVMFTTICQGGSPKWVIRKKNLTEVFRTGRRPIEHGIWEIRKNRLLGIGFIENMAPLQKLINDVLNIILNASVWALDPPGFYNPEGQNTGVISYNPGELIPILGSMPAMLSFPANFPVGFEILNFLIDLFQREAATSDQIQGSAGGVRTATATVKLIQEAYQNMSLCIKRVLEWVCKLDQQNYDLFVAYASPSMKYRVTGEKGRYEFPEFTQQDFMKHPDITLEVDIAETSKEYVQQVTQEVFGMVCNQVLIQTGVVTPEGIYNAAKAMLEARDQKNYHSFITKPPVLQSVDPETENYQITEGQIVIPMPQDDDQEHLKNHTAFIDQASELVEPEMINTVVKNEMNHIALHQNQMAMKLQQQQQAMAQLAMAQQVQQQQIQGNPDELQGKVTGRLNPGATSQFETGLNPMGSGPQNQQGMAIPENNR